MMTGKERRKRSGVSSLDGLHQFMIGPATRWRHLISSRGTGRERYTLRLHSLSAISQSTSPATQPTPRFSGDGFAAISRRHRISVDVLAAIGDATDSQSTSSPPQTPPQIFSRRPRHHQATPQNFSRRLRRLQPTPQDSQSSPRRFSRRRRISGDVVTSTDDSDDVFASPDDATEFQATSSPTVAPRPKTEKPASTRCRLTHPTPCPMPTYAGIPPGPGSGHTATAPRSRGHPPARGS